MTKELTGMEQTDRIKQMEQQFDRASQAVIDLSAAIDKYVEAQDALNELKAYYASEDWLRDYADDEAGKLPKDLKRGVLSEDGVWNLLSDCRELNIKMLETVTEMLKRD